MEKDIETIKQIINSSESTALLLEKDDSEESFLAKESLKTALLLKNIALISLSRESPDYFKKWAAFLSRDNLFVPQKIFINIPKDKYPIKELKYDENDKFFSLSIVTQGTDFNKDDLIFEKALPKVDSVFYFSKNPASAKLENFKDSLEIPAEERIIPIMSGSGTVSEKVFNIILALNLEENILKTSHLTTLLFAAILKETDNLTKNISKEILQAAAFLLDQGADKETIRKIFNQEKEQYIWQLLGRSLARTAIDENLKSSWTFLAKKDFEKNKTEAKPELLFRILKELKKQIPSQAFSFLVWESNLLPAEKLDKGAVWAIVDSQDGEKLKLLAEHLEAPQENTYIKTGPYASFSEAEINLRRALKNVLI